MPHSNKTINLSNSRLSHAFGDEECFWDAEIDRIMYLINEHLDVIDTRKSSEILDSDGHYKNLLSIALFGTYGSGKSSLLRTLVKRVNEGKEKRYDDLYSLHVIEPVLLEGGNLLYAFLAEALERERIKNRKDTESLRISPLVRRVQGMSGYLQAVDKNGASVENDPVSASLSHLEHQSSALRLNDEMRRFLDELAQQLTGSGRGAILLPVDDADMDPSSLVNTLQIYRRYLQHPRLIPIFTFTGRVAEELLRGHFEKQLEVDKDSKRQRIKEVSTKITIAENLAVQYLGKLFPVRNRIKLGVAAARAQQATFMEGTGKKKSTFDLLRNASQLLFGNANPPLIPQIRAPLRSSTLRRQIQIIDAMNATRIDLLFEMKKAADKSKEMSIEKFLEGKNTPRSISFAEVFGLATWSLLNVHRDVLKELDLHLDDLYSWTSKGLRQAILVSILNKDLGERRDMIKYWQYGTEQRRSLMISLLAANAFRPRMFSEEPTGDNAIQIRLMAGDPDSQACDGNARSAQSSDTKQADSNGLHRHVSFSSHKGIVWFLNLWHGFYLPLILARHRPQKREDDPRYEPVSGIGWSLDAAPVHAIREALNNNVTKGTGMLFLDQAEFWKGVSGLEEASKKDINEVKKDVDGLPDHLDNWQYLTLDIWCYYGIDRGQKWAAISFWRGLSLVGEILRASIDIQEVFQTERNKSVSHKEEKNEELIVYKEVFKEIIYRHLRIAHVLGAPSFTSIKEEPKPKEDEDEQNAELSQIAATVHMRFSGLSSMIDKLAQDFYDWVIAFQSWRIFPLLRPKKNLTEVLHMGRTNWKACFIRRIHGENLVNDFWQNLHNPSNGETGNKWNAERSLSKWMNSLFRYWDCGSYVSFNKNLEKSKESQNDSNSQENHLEDLKESPNDSNSQENRIMVQLGSCPILRPFVPFPVLIKKHLHKISCEIPKEILSLSKELDDLWRKDKFYVNGEKKLNQLNNLMHEHNWDLIKGRDKNTLDEIKKDIAYITKNFEKYRSIGKILQIPRKNERLVNKNLKHGY